MKSYELDIRKGDIRLLTGESLLTSNAGMMGLHVHRVARGVLAQKGSRGHAALVGAKNEQLRAAARHLLQRRLSPNQRARQPTRQ